MNNYYQMNLEIKFSQLYNIEIIGFFSFRYIKKLTIFQWKSKLFHFPVVTPLNLVQLKM
jgi:hypothetical protein